MSPQRRLEIKKCQQLVSSPGAFRLSTDHHAPKLVLIFYNKWRKKRLKECKKCSVFRLKTIPREVRRFEPYRAH